MCIRDRIKVTDGIISSKTGYKGDIVTYQISAPIQHGNSGGPLFDKQGNIVAVSYTHLDVYKRQILHRTTV